QFEACSRYRLTDGRERRAELLQAAKSTRRTDPDELGLRVGAAENLGGVFRRVHACGNDDDPFGSDPAPGFLGEVFVASNDEITCAYERLESAGSPGAFEAAAGVGIAEPHCIVEIEDELSNSLAQEICSQAWNQLALQDDGVGVA